MPSSPGDELIFNFLIALINSRVETEMNPPLEKSVFFNECDTSAKKSSSNFDFDVWFRSENVSLKIPENKSAFSLSVL